MPDHPHCHSTALVFSLYTPRDIDSDDSYARPLIHACAQPIVWFERERKLRAGHRAETRQTSCVFCSCVFFFMFFFVLPSFVPSFLPSFLSSFLPCFLPFLPSFPFSKIEHTQKNLKKPSKIWRRRMGRHGYEKLRTMSQDEN